MRTDIAKLALLLLVGLLAAPTFAQDVIRAEKEEKSESASQHSTAANRNGNQNRNRPETSVNKNQQVQGTATPSLDAEDKKDLDTRSATLPILSNPIVLAAAGLLLLIALALHVVHIVTGLRSKQEIAQLRGAIRTLSQRVSIGDEAGNQRAGASNELVQRLNRHRQGIDHLFSEVSQIEQRVAASERHAAETSAAVALAAHMAGEPRINHALEQAAVEIGEADRAAAIKIMQQYKELFGANALRVKTLIKEATAMVESIGDRSSIHREIVDRVQDLRTSLLQFESWHTEASERLASLRRGSVSDRYSAFTAAQAKLARQFNERAISIIDYVAGYRDLMEQHFPAAADESASKAPADHESDLKKLSGSVPDYLMDWFDKLSQLQTQAAQTSVDGETAAGLARIQRAARDVLGQFDIQPDEIQIGVTSFDRRLHDASLITQSPQYPANTVVAVQQYGFRKLSTGDVL
ncbi:MAG TPA: hypothetical protein VGL29_02605, partial [Blastocatellia bacterium]